MHAVCIVGCLSAHTRFKMLELREEIPIVLMRQTRGMINSAALRFLTMAGRAQGIVIFTRMALTYELFQIYQWLRWFSEAGIPTSDMKRVMDTLILSHGLFAWEVFLCFEVKPKESSSCCQF